MYDSQQLCWCYYSLFVVVVHRTLRPKENHTEYEMGFPMSIIPLGFRALRVIRVLKEGRPRKASKVSRS